MHVIDAEEEVFKKGDKLTGQIRSITDFGLFIGLDGSIDGLVHVSDISWTLDGDAAIRNYKKGQEVDAVIISIDVEKERIALGIKQLDMDPFTSYLNDHDRGNVVTGTVKEVSAEKVIVALTDDIDAEMAVRDATTEKADDATKLFAVGDSVEAMITNIDRKNRVINISVRAKDNKDEAEAIKRVKQAEKSAGTTSLGALLQDKMSQG